MFCSKRIPLALVIVLAAASAAAQELVEQRQGHTVTPRIVSPTPERVSGLRVPEGFAVNVFAEGLGAPRMMAVGPDGTIYVTRRKPGDVLALRDANGDGRSDGQSVAVRNLPDVHGIALRDGRMYLATVDAVYVVEKAGSGWGEPRKLVDRLPPGGRHPNRTLGFAPDGQLFVSVGSTCNACVEESEESAAILTVAADGSGRKVFASGLRNTIGFGWHPETGEMWGMDHGTDWLGDTSPPEELNRLQGGHDYGWPFLYATGDTMDNIAYPPGFDLEKRRRTSTGMVMGYEAHAAPIQLAFYAGTAFPDAYRGDAFVAMHGSWNRRPPSGYEVVRIDFENGQPRRFEPFLTGFLLPDRSTAFGRPAGIAVASDGSLLVGDDANGVIYRVSRR